MLSLLVLWGCNETPKTLSDAEKEGVKEEVASAVQKYHDETTAKNIDTVMSLFTEDGLYCGTDKDEFWSYTDLTNMMKYMMSDSANTLVYNIEKLEIKVSNDGKSAIAVEQYHMPHVFGENLPVRSITHLVKVEDSWKIDFLNWSLLPANQDLGKIITVLEK